MFGLTPFENRGFDIFDPFRGFDEELHRGGFAPCRTDIKDEGDKFVMETEMPGFDKKDINIDINGDVLTLSAKHEANTEDKTDSGKYIRRERTYGSYKRSFDLTGVDTDNIAAQYQNGILTLTMPKKQPEVPTARRLEIN